MAKNGFRVLDSDLHVFEPVDLYERYLDKRFQERIYKVPNPEGTQGVTWVVDGYTFPMRFLGEHPDASKRDVLDHYRAQNFDSVSQLEAMDVEGLDQAVLFRTSPKMGIEDLEPEFAIALCRAWNDWITDFRQLDSKRMQAAAILTLHDVDLTVQELRRCVTELGMVGTQLLPNPIKGREIHDPVFDPLWAEAERLNVPICFHPTPNTYHKEHFANRFVGPYGATLSRMLCNPVEQMAAIGSMTVGGVFERFPRLRAAFLEANCSWIPWFLWRLDEYWELNRNPETDPLQAAPSEYFRRQAFVNVEPDEHFAGWVIEQMGDDNLIYSSDYPHVDSRFPEATSLFLKLDIPEKSKEKILWDNCARLYGF